MDVTKQTRLESYFLANKSRFVRSASICEILADSDGMTAREIAAELEKSGVIPSNERNYTAPRLTELKQTRKVETVGKKKCSCTGRMVAVWRLRKDV